MAKKVASVVSAACVGHEEGGGYWFVWREGDMWCEGDIGVKCFHLHEEGGGYCWCVWREGDMSAAQQ